MVEILHTCSLALGIFSMLVDWNSMVQTRLWSIYEANATVTEGYCHTAGRDCQRSNCNDSSLAPVTHLLAIPFHSAMRVATQQAPKETHQAGSNDTNDSANRKTGRGRDGGVGRTLCDKCLKSLHSRTLLAMVPVPTCQESWPMIVWSLPNGLHVLPQYSNAPELPHSIP